MKDLKNTILEDISPKITWDEFIKVCWSYFESKKDHINMYDVFNLPPRSRTGLPKVLPNVLKDKSSKNLDIYNKKLIESFVGKNIRALGGSYGNNWLQIQMCSPLPGNIIGFPITNMDMLIKTIGEDNVIKIYKFIKENII
jgi:hypothetical protein